MTQDQVMTTIASLCAMVLVGATILRWRMDFRSWATLIAFWVAVIVAGFVLARLWLAHRPY